jgi:hypothetical protein
MSISAEALPVFNAVVPIPKHEEHGAIEGGNHRSP